MSSIYVSKDFKRLCDNLRMNDNMVTAIRNRYHSIRKRINMDYWNTSSETSHSLYVGSYGRGTCIYTSDIDIVVELPWTIFAKYDAYTYNGQSALLQDVKNSLKRTYSSSSLNGDGQVVDIFFSDGVKFEVVPTFLHSDASYTYPDSNSGGSWKTMEPRIEATAFNRRDIACSGNLRRLCRMARAWNEKMTVLMPGILIDTLAYKFMENYQYRAESFIYFDWMSRDFFKYLIDESNKACWYKFGSHKQVCKQYNFQSEAKKAHKLSIEALTAYDKDYTYTWHDKWRDIYGTKFPAT